jgi:hypothetical protein
MDRTEGWYGPDRGLVWTGPRVGMDRTEGWYGPDPVDNFFNIKHIVTMFFGPLKDIKEYKRIGLASTPAMP